MRLATRSRISFADLLVKVIAAMRLAGWRPVPIRCAIFSTITRVLPLPAPASTSSEPSTWATAADCWGLRPCIGKALEADAHLTRRVDVPSVCRHGSEACLGCGSHPGKMPEYRCERPGGACPDRKSTTSELQSLMRISYAVFRLKKKTSDQQT